MISILRSLVKDLLS
uniref:Uncharacterized protein n=1 Tax=Rhizophora mucronata TaxID=61149 RepID=A0A2P2PNI3_RHIMU